MSVFKRLTGGSHVIEPFELNATQSFQWTSGSSNIDGFSINLAKEPPEYYPIGTSDLGGETNGGFYSYPLYESVKDYFFLGAPYEYYPNGSMFVWNVGSGYYGIGIKPQSFKVEINGVNTFVQDDGKQNLRLNKTGSIVGTIFYEHGVAAIQRDSGSAVDSVSADGISIQASGGVTSSFLSVVNIYEHTINCKLSPTDYQYTFNPTIFDTGSDGIKYSDLMKSGSVTPYITTVGLYNDFNELIAVGKLSKPITRLQYTDQTFVIKFDE